jgi:hypothetical protein
VVKMAAVAGVVKVAAAAVRKAVTVAAVVAAEGVVALGLAAVVAAAAVVVEAEGGAEAWGLGGVAKVGVAEQEAPTEVKGATGAAINVLICLLQIAHHARLL